MKSYSVIAAAVASVAMFGGVVLAQSFPDVDESHVNYDAIEYVKSEGIVKGYEDGTYGPDASINRAEFMKIVVEAVVGQEPLEHAGSCFTDVSSGVWYYPYICYAERVGWVSGYPDGSFKPGQDISFVEAAKIISNAYEYGASEGQEVWYRPFVTELADRDAIPMSVEDFAQKITRGEMAEIIYRLKAEVSGKDSRSYEGLAGVLPEGDFTYNVGDDWMGALYVRGYVDVQQAGEFDYVMFKVTENSSDNANKDDFQTFLDKYDGNAFVGEDSVGLGCADNGRIYTEYIPAEDTENTPKYFVSKEDSSQILASRAENEVMLKLTRVAGIDGHATTCSSLFNGIEVVK